MDGRSLSCTDLLPQQRTFRHRFKWILDGTVNLNITNLARNWRLVSLAAASALIILFARLAWPVDAGEFHFALLGDRTGEAQRGVYEEAWREAVAAHPAFVLTVGDSIQGGNDQTLDAEWGQFSQIIASYNRYKLFLTPGNHDVWDAASQRAFEKYSHHPLHYSFDWQNAHFTVLDDSESDDLKPEELSFLESDLRIHNHQPVKFIVSHRPSWLFFAVLRNPSFPLHQLALKYGVKYVIAGHIHQMLHFNLDGVTYLSMASSGGHLRSDKSYEHGWFFQHADVSVSNHAAAFRIEELSAPFGQSRVTTPDDWGAAGLSPLAPR
jgi:Icc protein